MSICRFILFYQWSYLSHIFDRLTDSLAVVCESQTPIAAVKEVCCSSIRSERSISNLIQWDDAGLHPIMRENVRLCLYDKPTAIQSFALPAVSHGKDLIGIAHTGEYSIVLYLMSKI